MTSLTSHMRIWSGAVVLAATTLPAHAHHVMGGQLPSTFMQGLLSGLGHPVIGLDHLAFIVALGIGAALVPAGLGLIAAFIAASTCGVFVHLAELDVPLSELLVAASVVIAGALLIIGRNVPSMAWLALAALAGLFHGYAFGESIVGAERSVISAYLIGIALISGLIAFGVMQGTKWLLGGKETALSLPRFAGLALSCGGIALVATNLLAA